MWAVSQFPSYHNVLNFPALAQQAVKVQESTNSTTDQDELHPVEDLWLSEDIRLTLDKLHLKTRNDHVVAGTFVLQSLLAQELPRALRLQLKKQLRRLETVVTVSDSPESQQDAPEVLYVATQAVLSTNCCRP